MSEFTVEISRPGEFGALTSATLELPATQAEYHDAMEKARITDYKVIYSYELLHCKHDWLRSHIPATGNLLELNLLAIRMDKYIKDDMDIYKVMVKSDAKRNSHGATPLSRLINLTFSIENCHVAGNIASDAQLGKFLYENDMLPKEASEFAAARIFWGSETENERFGLIGARHRQREGGVFTDSGRYVEFDGSVNEVYVPSEMTYFDCSGARVVLEISQPHDMEANFELIRQAHHRLRKVIIENKDFEKLIGQYDRPVSFFYLDPPYYATEGYYQNVGEDGFTERDHIRLWEALLAIDGKFLLSYNDCEFVRELYDAPGIWIMETSRINNIKQRYDGGCQFSELLIANYDLRERSRLAPEQMNLFDIGGGIA